MKKILFTGGGTGGHIYPALAIIEQLRQGEQQLEIGWMGQKKGPEEALAKSNNIAFYGIDAGKFRRYFSFKNFTDLFVIIKAYYQAKVILKKIHPHLLFSKGGFVSLPPVVAAYFLKIPIFLHESDSDPGLANRLAARFATKIFVPYKESIGAFKQKYRHKIEVSGNPVRSAVAKASRLEGRALYQLDHDDFLVLVLGGSSGAKQVNDLVTGIVADLSKKALIIHQMGAKLFVESSNPHYITRSYIDDELPNLMAASDVVISRAGAGALWEFATLGLVPILIPLGMRGDQGRNATILQKRGACIILEGEKASSRDLLIIVNDLLSSKERRSSISKAIKQLINFDAKEFLVTKIYDYLAIY